MDRVRVIVMPLRLTCKSCGTPAILPDPPVGKPRCEMCGAFFKLPGAEAQKKAPVKAKAPLEAMDALDFGAAPAAAIGRQAPGPAARSAPAADPAPVPVPRAEPAARQEPAARSAPRAAIPLEPPPLELLEVAATASRGKPAGLDGLDFASPRGGPPASTDAAPIDSQALYYPCRVCDVLFTAPNLYAESDGETICRPCFKEHGPQAQRSGAALPAGLELAPAVDPRKSPDGVFCEQCKRILSPSQLRLTANGSVLCSSCMRKNRIAEREAKRQAEQLANFRGDARPPADKNEIIGNALRIVGSLAAIAFVVWRLMLAEMIPNPFKPAPKYKHGVVGHVKDSPPPAHP